MDLRGQRIRNRYLLGALLGEGADALVYCAMDRHLGRVVAVKLLRPELCADPTLVERFEREARSASRLNHPNIVPIYDYGKALDTYFFVMEYVRGGHLGAYLRPGQPVPSLAALWLAAHVADALGAAHARGIVHRDVKPANVLLTEEGCPKLTDFGIAKLLDIPAVTRASVLLGTPHYLAPEQASGGAITPATDVYALGVVLYEMLAGRRPFVGNGLLHVAMQHVHVAPPPLADLNPAVSPALAAIVARTLAKDPAQRFADGAALAAALRGVARALGGSASAVVASEPADPGVAAAAVRREVASGGSERTRSAARQSPSDRAGRDAERVVAAGWPAGESPSGPARERSATSWDNMRAGRARPRLAVAALPPDGSASVVLRSRGGWARSERAATVVAGVRPRSYALRGRRGATARRVGLLAAGLGLVLSGLVSARALHGAGDDASTAAWVPTASESASALAAGGPEAIDQATAGTAANVDAEQGSKPIVTLEDAPRPAEPPAGAAPVVAESAPGAATGTAAVPVVARSSAPPPAAPVRPSQSAAASLRMASASARPAASPVDQGPPRAEAVPTLGTTTAAAAEEPADEDSGADA